MQVSIIIVNYNTKELLNNCLKSIYKYTKDIDFEIIVSDNGSTDNSISMLKTEFPQVIIVDNGKNLGFGAANNKGLEIAKGKYIFYYSPLCKKEYYEKAQQLSLLTGLPIVVTQSHDYYGGGQRLFMHVVLKSF